MSSAQTLSYGEIDVALGKSQVAIGNTEVASRLVSHAATGYVLLWIFEGALRKWGPSVLYNPLYFLRDFAIVSSLILAVLLKPKMRAVPKTIIAIECAVILLSCLQLFFSQLTLAVALVGVRQFLGPLALIHLVLGYADSLTVTRMSKILILVAPIECVISLLQALSPAASWINAVGKDEYTNFFTANGVVRTSGTFTAAYGLVCYLMLTAGVVLARSSKPDGLLERLALPMICLMTLVSGSRSAILFLAIAFFANLVTLVGKAGKSRVMMLVKGCAAITIGVSLALVLAPNVIEAFRERSQDAEQTQSSSDRINQQAFAFIAEIPTLTALGSGLGGNSAAGIAAGSQQPWIEDELGRWIHEAGLLGLVAVAMREVAAPWLLVTSWKRFKRQGDRQPFLITCIFIPSLVAGLVNTQPSQQGFAALTAVFIAFRIVNVERVKT